MAGQIVHDLRTLGRALRSHAWSFAHDFGLTPTQGEIIRLLRERGPMRAIELANAMGIGKASLSKTIHVMELKVLVRRKRRRGPIELTVPGVDEADNTPMWSGAVADAAIALEAEDRKTLARLLGTLLRDVVARDHRSNATSARRKRWPDSMMRPPLRRVKLPFDTGFVD